MIFEIDTYKLLGRIEPVGETTEDNERLENINNYDLLVRHLIGEMYRTAKYKESNRYSERKLGEKSYRLLHGLKQEIDGYLDLLKEI